MPALTGSAKLNERLPRDRLANDSHDSGVLFLAARALASLSLSLCRHRAPLDGSLANGLLLFAVGLFPFASAVANQRDG